MNPVSFPKQGEVIQFIFDALGVLPRKHEDDASFDETRKKSTQKALQRLALEEGTLDQRLGKMVQTLSYLVAGTIQLRECLALGDILSDLFEIYQNTLRDEGTFLTKSDTVKWFLLTSAAFRLPISVAKHLQRYNVAADGLVTPADIYWYLPTKEPDGWIWPLEKVIRWAYQLAGISIQKFHCPDDAGHSTQEQNYDNAKNWLAGRGLPSWPTLLKNFNQFFDTLDQSQAEGDRLPLSETQKNSIRMALFAARATTYISKSVLSHYGGAVLQEFCSRYHIVADCVVEDVQKISNCVQKIITKQNISLSEQDRLWYDVCTDYWRQFAEHQHAVTQALDNKRITNAEAVDITRGFGRLAILPFQKPEAFAPQHAMPAGFSEAILDGLALRKSADLNIEKIEAYAARLDDCGLRHVLPWMVPWQLATYHYRAERYNDAYTFIRDAFEKAKYCAGRHQYILLNQYIELAAKNDKWRDFKRGIEWATYLGFDVRWLRQDEPTTEKLRIVFEIMKKAVYAN
ncbi:MAG: hypothetical protein HHJ12_19735 [Glaciimonas sp.]|nr:hypothetical protein [Glaciimonas sp.]